MFARNMSNQFGFWVVLLGWPVALGWFLGGCSHDEEARRPESWPRLPRAAGNLLHGGRHGLRRPARPLCVKHCELLDGRLTSTCMGSLTAAAAGRGRRRHRKRRARALPAAPPAMGTPLVAGGLRTPTNKAAATAATVAATARRGAPAPMAARTVATRAAQQFNAAMVSAIKSAKVVDINRRAACPSEDWLSFCRH